MTNLIRVIFRPRIYGPEEVKALHRDHVRFMKHNKIGDQSRTRADILKGWTEANPNEQKVDPS
jgi:hypothetical protein